LPPIRENVRLIVISESFIVKFFFRQDGRFSAIGDEESLIEQLPDFEVEGVGGEGFWEEEDFETFQAVAIKHLIRIA
jgi:hypothetical protein